MDDTVQEFITGIGAIAETLAIYRDVLLRNGFDRSETGPMVLDLQNWLLKKDGGNHD